MWGCSIRVLIACLGLLCTVVPASAAAADAEEDTPHCLQVTWQAVVADCDWTFAEYTETSSSQPAHTWVTTIQCANGGICADEIECVEDGRAGFWHDIYMDGIDVGDVCMPDEAVDQVNIVALITRQFRRMDWPASQLVVQPPGGKTLVNFATNFYTDNDEPIEKTVRIAGRQVHIRATQVTYTFHFGDGTSVDSATPGRPHPNLDITHVYTRVADMSVSLDTTYSGEYRIGDGAWTPLDTTLTVAGPGQDLEVVEALPQLVLR